ncbi:winged helix-turn-helix transcriptional regulator [Bdellovibrio sp. HCB209]|uniref:winged helix-turn-helix transcriptional regulator n=1 Tax=Bdellovibrio sp. HCB209 TaxID=3394354 RepID=UPI0039B4DDE9
MKVASQLLANRTIHGAMFTGAIETLPQMNPSVSYNINQMRNEFGAKKALVEGLVGASLLIQETVGSYKAFRIGEVSFEEYPDSDLRGNKLRILISLSKNPTTTQTELVQATGLSRRTIISELNSLRELNYVLSTKNGNKNTYAILKWK